MLKSVIVTRHDTVEYKWIIAVPDNMADDCIEELVKELENGYDLDLDEEEGVVEVSVDIADAPSGATTPDLTLTDDGLVDEDSILTAFTTDRLQAELERRRAKESDMSVV